MTRQSIAVVSACMQRDGRPTFVHTEVSVTPEEAEDADRAERTL